MYDIASADPFPDVTLSDGDLTLRRWLPGDAVVRVRAGQDPAIQRWTSVPRNVDEAAALGWIAWSQRAWCTGEAFYFAIVAGCRCVGSAGLIRMHPRDLRAEVGYWLVDDARGRGVATRALQVLTEWSFAQLNVARLDLFVNTDNDASMAVAQRAGYTREALLRSWHGDVTTREDLVLFGMLRSEVGGHQGTR